MLQKRLGGRWLVLGEHRLAAGGGECLIDFVFLHQDHGVVLVLADRGPYAVPELAIGVLRSLLLRHGFPLRFPGHLPVVCVSIDRAEAAELPARLDEAFAASAPIEIADARWLDFLVAALVAENAPAWAPAAPPPTAAASEAAPHRRLSPSMRDAVVAAAAIGLFAAGLAAAPYLFGGTVPPPQMPSGPGPVAMAPAPAALPLAVVEAPEAVPPVPARIVLPQRKPAPPAPARAQAPAGKECRPYTAASATPGPLRSGGGVACRMEDGRWRIVSHQPG